MGKKTKATAAVFIFFVAISTVAVVSPTVYGQSWTHFQNDSINTGGQTVSEPPPVNGQDLNTRTNSPLVAPGGEFVFFDSSGDVRSHSFGSDDPNWVFERERSFDETPIVEDGNVFFTEVSNVTILGGADGSVLSVDSSGEERWRTGFDSPIGSSPAVSDGILYVGAGTSLNALDSDTGEKVWSADTDAMTGGPVPSGDDIYAASIPLSQARDAILESPLGEEPADVDGSLYSFSREGEKNWRSEDVAVTGYPAVSDRHVYVGTFNRTLKSLSRDTGETAWVYEVNGTPNSPVYYNGTVYVSTLEGSLYAVDGETGETDWTKETGGEPYLPAVSEDTVYLADRGGGTWVLDAQNGTVLWNDSVLGTIRSPPTVYNGNAYVSHREQVYVFPREIHEEGGTGAETDTETDDQGDPDEREEVDDGDETETTGEVEPDDADEDTTEEDEEDRGYVSILIPLLLAFLFLAGVSVCVYANG